MAVYGFTVNCDGNVVDQMAKIQQGLKGMGVTAKVETEKAEGAFTNLGNSIKEAFGGIKSILLGGLGIGAAFEGIELIKNSKEYFDQNEASIAKVNAALASTKGVAGETASHLADVAKALDGKVIFSRPQIQDAQSMLLTFTQIRGEIYDKTLPAITDFATRFKMELPEAANMLGKALNDPLKGMTRLQREGVVFSDSQKNTIKNFVSTGQVAKAQQVILDELKNEFGGLSEAMAKTDEGKLAMAAKQWDDIKLQVGEIVSKIEVALIPVIGFLANVLRGTLSLFTSTSTAATIFRTVLLTIGGALVAYYTYLGLAAAKTAIFAAATTIAGTATELLGWYSLAAAEGMGVMEAAAYALDAALDLNPISLIVIGIAALIAIVGILWDKFKGFREFMGGMWGYIKQNIKDIGEDFKDLGTIMYDVFHGNFKQALTDAGKLMDDFSKHTADDAAAVAAGKLAAGNSTFKFGNILKFGGGAGETDAQQSANAAAGSGGNAITNHALKTSELSGAKGGLGEAKRIDVRIDTVMRIGEIVSGKAPEFATEAAQQIIRTVNNLANGGSSTQ